ncbi:MAG: uracil-DNA glycosylase [Alphaproteobacteria bacterium]|nr:uracil-DNA glycosylase [Alphaproteobacteria bacterium]
MAQNALLKATLQWYLDNGVDEILGEEPIDRTQMPVIEPVLAQKQPQSTVAPPLATAAMPQQSPADLMGAAEAMSKARELAQGCNSAEELKKAIADFDGLSIKKTAMNMVFCDGNPKAPIMLIGEAPGADEDRQGKPFVGVSGQLLDRILASIGLDRQEEDPLKSVYISNILNWRPPGNRTPSQSEIDISLPFIKRHIELIEPKILILLGGVSGKAILDRSESISRLRGTFHDFNGVQTIATYHPAYLLRTPAQKRAVWQDMLMINAKRKEMDILSE